MVENSYFKKKIEDLTLALEEAKKPCPICPSRDKLIDDLNIRLDTEIHRANGLHNHNLALQT